MCYPTGDGLEEATIRAEAYFTIHACDRHGEPTRGGGERFRIVFRGRSAPQWRLSDVGDGTYAGSFMASVSGEYEMNVTLDGAAIRGSPFRLHVKAGIAQPSLCEASGDGFERVRAGERARLHIRAVDTLGVPKASGGDAFAGALYGPYDRSVAEETALSLAPHKELRFSDLRNGGYACSYTLHQSGTYLLVVEEETTSEPIRGSPFRVDVIAGPLHAPGMHPHPNRADVHGHRGRGRDGRCGAVRRARQRAAARGRAPPARALRVGRAAAGARAVAARAPSSPSVVGAARRRLASPLTDGRLRPVARRRDGRRDAHRQAAGRRGSARRCPTSPPTSPAARRRRRRRLRRWRPTARPRRRSASLSAS